MRFISCSLTFFFLCGFFSLAEAGPAIRIDDPVWNAGIIISGKTYEKIVSIENVGNEPLVIEKIEECCGFFAEVQVGMRLLPGEKGPLLLRLAPFQFAGDLRGEMFVLSNDPNVPKLAVVARAQVVPRQHALGELKVTEVDLGVIDPRDRVPMAVKIGNTGNLPLVVRQFDLPAVVIGSGFRPEIAPGEEQAFSFDFIPNKVGPIDEKIGFVTNDALNRVLEFRIKGYVSDTKVSGRGLSIYPLAGDTVYDVVNKVYRYEFSIKNEGPESIYLPGAEVDLQQVKLDYKKFISSGETMKFTATVPLNQATSGMHYIILQVRLPFSFD